MLQQHLLVNKIIYNKIYFLKTLFIHLDPLHNNPRVFMSTPFTRPATSVQQSLMQQTQFPSGSSNNFFFIISFFNIILIWSMINNV